MADLRFLLQPHKWNWLNLSLAVLITACIFTATSFVSPIVPAPADAVQIGLQPGAIGCANGTNINPDQGCEQNGAAAAP